MQYRIIICLVVIALLVGTVSADTMILYIDITARDGYMTETSDATWQTIRNDAGHGSGTGSNNEASLFATTSSSTYSEMRRGGLIFNTSKLGSGATVTGATITIYVSARDNTLGAGSYGFTTFRPESNNTIATGDYDSWTNTRIASDKAYVGISTSANNTWTFTNLTPIDNTGYTPIMFRDKWDMDNDSTGLTWSRGNYSYITYRDTSIAGTGQDPYMTITYTTGVSAPVASFTVQKPLYRIPGILQANDTSTNTPTAWNWSWGDGTANSTTQNPTHQYTKRGIFTINMAATNAGGTGVATAQTVRVVGYENLW